MSKYLWFLLILLFCASSASAQFTPKTIKEIQTTKSETNDTSALHKMKVKVEGVVVTDPEDWYQAAEATKRYAFWLQEKGQNGPQTGIQVYVRSGRIGDEIGVNKLKPGMLVEIHGTVDYFLGEIQIAIDTNTNVSAKAVGQPIADPVKIEVGILNDANEAAQPTGDVYQGSLVTIENVTVTSINTNSTRGNFTVADSKGNRIEIWDASRYMRTSSGKDFVKPSSVGIFYNSITGIVYHRGTNDGRGEFQIFPFDGKLMVSKPESVPPVVNNLVRNPVCPKSSAPVSITADVLHTVPGVNISEVKLKWAVGGDNKNYQDLVLNNTSASTYTGNIPAQPVGSFVHYYLEAKDSNGNITKYNNIGSPFSYRVNDNGCTISDIQYVAKGLFDRGDSEGFYGSGYRNMAVTGVKGVVVASGKANNLGFCYIQEEGKTSWAGIQVVGNIENLNVGDRVTIETGKVSEFFGLTQITDAQITINQAGGTPIEPIVVPIANLSGNDQYSYAHEEYEGMYIKIADQNLRVIDTMPDPTNNNLKNDWRIGTNPEDPNKGLRIATGGTSGSRCSKNVGWINSSEWEISLNSGIKPKIITTQCTLTSIEGILAYDWNRFKLLPRTEADIVGMDCKGVSRPELLTSTAGIKVYPNPTSGQLNIQTNDGVQVTKLALIDVTGRIVKTTTLSGESQIDVSELPSGIYSMIIYTQQDNYSTKLIVE